MRRGPSFFGSGRHRAAPRMRNSIVNEPPRRAKDNYKQWEQEEQEDPQQEQEEQEEKEKEKEKEKDQKHFITPNSRSPASGGFYW